MRPQDLPLMGFCAYSGNGKTSLLRRVIPLLGTQGLRVGLVKHAHHSFELDYPGKDSYELRKAGAAQVVVASRHRMACITEFSDGSTEPTLEQALAPICSDHLDLVLVEGFKHAAIPKIEVHRPSLGMPLICRQDNRVVAVATDDPGLDTGAARVTLLDLNNPMQVADYLVQRLGFASSRQCWQGAANA